MDLMLDLETLGSRPDAAVMAIGACEFAPGNQNSIEQLKSGVAGVRSFYVVVDLKGQERSRSFDAGAVYFWMKQSDAARLELAADERSKTHPLTALTQFVAFCNGVKPRLAWANGATFDHVILQSLFDSFGIKNPIHYTNQVDMRTIRKILVDGNYPDMYAETVLVPHNALDDCYRQIVWLQRALKTLLNSTDTRNPSPTLTEELGLDSALEDKYNSLYPPTDGVKG